MLQMNRVDDAYQSEEDEISKKDLLQETGVSYGQFYRWKRMGLIPEAWFRRRSTFTGQESFLPRGKVLERIGRIQELKDRLSLDEIGEMLSPESARRTFSLSEVQQMRGFDASAIELLPVSSNQSELRYLDLLGLFLIRDLQADRLSDDQIRLACRTFLDRFDELDASATDRSLVVGVIAETTVCALHTGTCLFDNDTVIVASVNLNRLVENLNLTLRDAEAA